MSGVMVEVEQPRLSAEYKKTRWAGLASMAVAFISDGMEGGLINTLFPVIMDALSLSLGALGVLTSISRYARMLFGTLWSMVADRFGRKKVLIFVTGIWGLWTIGVGFAQNYTQLLILYSIAVIGTVAGEPIANGLLRDMFEDDERGKAYGAMRSVSSLGSLVLTPLIGRLANIPDGWRIGMYVMAGTSILSGILIALFVKEPPKGKVDETDPEAGKFNIKDVGTLLKTPTVLLLAIQLLFITSLVLFAFMVTFFVKARGWETANAAVLSSVFFGGFMLSSFIGGFLGDLFERRMGPKGRIVLMQLYLVGFAIMTFLMTQIDWGLGFMAYFIVFLSGLVGSIGFSGCVLPMVASVVEPKYSATAFALLFSFIQGAISATMSLAIAPLSKTLSLVQIMLYLVVLPYAINAIFWFLFYKVYPKDVANLKARMAAGAG